jgi:predicted nucleotide-binding protein
MEITHIDEIVARLDKAEAPLKTDSAKQMFDAIDDAIDQVEVSWSGSWLGYQARVYYENLQEPPPGARFSKEWGLEGGMGIGRMGTAGAWREFRRQDVIDEVWNIAENPDISELRKLAVTASRTFDDAQSELQSILSPILSDYEGDKFLADLAAKIEGFKIYGETDFLGMWSPKGQQMSRDANAINAGIHVPPHFSVKADSWVVRNPFMMCGELATVTKRLASHLTTLQKRATRSKRVGTNIFIGHGQSKIWKDLKDFIQDRLRLPWDEFNRVPVAGVTNIARLSEMLDQGAFAFVIMTAEDEQADGKYRARMNVVHEAGLFQGRLGFEKAIILLEDGCEEFCNVQGLGQIRFPKDDISKAFEEIRMVLEREELIPESKEA